MGRIGRRSRRKEFLSQVQDPGKDLFAYLFLVMLIFSFVILVTYEVRIQSEKAKRSPNIASQGSSNLVKVRGGEIGKLAKKQGVLCLVFGGKMYRPDEDLKLLEQKGIVKTIKDEMGKETKMIYIEEDPQSRIYLREYLEAFRELSDQGIDISFIRRVD